MDRYDEERMADTLYSDRLKKDKVDRTSYMKGLYDAIETMRGFATAGVSPGTISRLLDKLAEQAASNAHPH